jgi:class 3 adenylate cyclase
MSQLLDQIRRLETAINEQETLRAALGDAVAAVALQALETQLAELKLRAAAEDLSPREQRKFASVLFARLDGLAAQAEDVDAEVVHDLLDLIWARLDPVIVAHGGTIDQHMEGGLMALFGAPQALERHAEMAVRAALALRAELARMGAELSGQLGSEPALRVGVNTGEMLMTAVGQGDARRYTVMGTAINVASRLESLARPGQVVVGAATHQLVEPLFVCRPLDSTPVRGLARPLALYEVVALHAGEHHAQWRAPLVGRARELQILQARLAALRAGRGGVVALVGEAGLGKSRLLAEARAAAGDDLAWHASAVRAHGQAPFGVALEWLRGLCGAPADDSADAFGPAGVQHALHQLVRQLGLPEPEFSVPTLARVWATPDVPPDLPAVRQDAAALQRQVVQEFAMLAGLRALAQPLALVIDDVHWADAATLALLDRLAELAMSTPLALIMTVRPDAASPATALQSTLRTRWAEGYDELALAPLPPGAAAELAGALLGEAPADARAALLARAEGNPFYIEELARVLAEDLREWSEVPASLRAVIAARVDRLPEAPRRVLQLAAVVGRDFTPELLSALVAATPETAVLGAALPGALVALERAGLIEAGDPGAYAFHHNLVQETVYQELSLRLRRRLHAQAAQALVQLYGDAPEQVAALAYHYEQAGEAGPAQAYLERAAAQARAAFAPRDALGYLERALAFAGDARVVARLRLQCAYLYLQLADPEGAHTQAQAALAAEDERVQAEAYWLMANAGLQRNLEQAWDSLTRGLALARAAGDRRILARCLAWYGCLGVWGGKLASRAEGQARLHEGAALAAAEDDAAFWLDCYDAYKDIGTPEDERQAYERALALAEAQGDRRMIVTLLAYQADLCSRIGEHAAAVSYAELAEAQGMRDHPMRAYGWRALGWSLHNLGDGEAAVQHLEQSLALFQQLGLRSRIAGTYLRLCLARQELGQAPAEARAEAERWLAAARAIGEPSEEAYALADVAWLDWQAGAHGAARTALAAATALLDSGLPWWYEMGVRELCAEVRLAMGDAPAALSAAERLEAIGDEEGIREPPVRAAWLRARALLADGRGDEARRAAERGLQLAMEMGQARYCSRLRALAQA